MTPDGCCSTIGVETGVAGTDLLATEDRPSTDAEDIPATAVDRWSTVPAAELVVNCRPGIGRAGGAKKTQILALKFPTICIYYAKRQPRCNDGWGLQQRPTSTCTQNIKSTVRI